MVSKGNVKAKNVCVVRANDSEHLNYYIGVRMALDNENNLYLEVKDNNTHNDNYILTSITPLGDMRRFELWEDELHTWNMDGMFCGINDKWNKKYLFYVLLLEQNIVEIYKKMRHRKTKSYETIKFGRYYISINYYNKF